MKTLIALILLLVMAGCTDNAKETDTCTLPGVTPDMVCTKTKNGCSCELPHEAFMKQMRRRACQYRMVGMKLLPDVEKDLKEHPEACEGEGYSGEWSSGECLNIVVKGKCPDGSHPACASSGPACFKVGR